MDNDKLQIIWDEIKMELQKDIATPRIVGDKTAKEFADELGIQETAAKFALEKRFKAGKLGKHKICINHKICVAYYPILLPE